MGETTQVGASRDGNAKKRAGRVQGTPVSSALQLAVQTRRAACFSLHGSGSPMPAARQTTCKGRCGASGPLGPKLPRPHPPSGARSLRHLDSEARMQKLWRGIGTHPRATPTRQERSAVPDGRQRPAAAGMRRWLRSSGGGRSLGARSPRFRPRSNSAPKCLCRKTC